MTSRKAAIGSKPAKDALQRRDFFAVMAAGSVAATQATAGEPANHGEPVPANEWIDPQFCFQDQNQMVAAINDAGTATVAPLTVTRFSTGSLTIVAQCFDTSQIYVGSLGYFAGAGLDPVLAASDSGERRVFRITAIVTNASFTVISEQYWGAPIASTACAFQPIMRGAKGLRAGNITSNTGFYGSSAVNVWLSDRPAHVARFKGCANVIVFQVTGADGAISFQPNKPLSYYRSQNRAVGMAAVVLSGSGSAQAYINNGVVVHGGILATENKRTWLSLQRSLGELTYYQVGVALTGPGYYMVGEFTEAASNGPISDGGFSTPLWGCAKALASVSPWIGINVDFPSTASLTVDMMQVSRGQIRPGVSYFWGLLEGQNITAVGQFFASACTTGATIYNPIMASYNTSFYTFTQGNYHLDANARISIYGNAGGQWRHVSWDISMAFIGTSF